MFAALFRLLAGAVRRAHDTASVRFVIYGIHSPDWMTALAPKAPVWRRLPAVRRVQVVPAGGGAAIPLAPNGLRTVVLPLMEPHILACPRRYDGLVPDRRAVEICGNKATFAAFVAEQGLTELAPRAYCDAAEAVFPCVLKRPDLNSGRGVVVADSAEALKALLAAPPWQGHPHLLQAYEPARYEYVTHCVCVGGRILWHFSIRYELPPGQRVRTPGSAVLVPFDPPPERIAEMERFLLPLGYDGPCNIDYTIREDGSLCVFEINPRLGGSLMKPSYIDQLSAALGTIAAHARPLAEPVPAGAGSDRIGSPI